MKVGNLSWEGYGHKTCKDISLFELKQVITKSFKVKHFKDTRNR